MYLDLQERVKNFRMPLAYTTYSQLVQNIRLSLFIQYKKYYSKVPNKRTLYILISGFFLIRTFLLLRDCIFVKFESMISQTKSIALFCKKYSILREYSLFFFTQYFYLDLYVYWFFKIFQPVRLIGPVRLLGTLEQMLMHT